MIRVGRFGQHYDRGSAERHGRPDNGPYVLRVLKRDKETTPFRKAFGRRPLRDLLDFHEHYRVGSPEKIQSFIKRGGELIPHHAPGRIVRWRVSVSSADPCDALFGEPDQHFGYLL